MRSPNEFNDMVGGRQPTTPNIGGAEMTAENAAERIRKLLAEGTAEGLLRALRLIESTYDYVDVDIDMITDHPAIGKSAWIIKLYDDDLKTLYAIEVTAEVESYGGRKVKVTETFFIDWIDAGVAVYSDFKHMIKDHLDYFFPAEEVEEE